MRSLDIWHPSVKGGAMSNINRILTQVTRFIKDIIKESVNLVIDKIREGDIAHEDNISADLGARLETLFLKRGKGSIEKLRARYQISFRYIKTPVGAWETRVGGMDIIWLIVTKVVKDSTMIYARIKGVKLQAKRCACTNGKLTTNSFGSWLKKNPNSLWESCKKMRKRSTFSFRNKSIKIGGQGYIIIYTNDYRCGFRVFSCREIPNSITCEGLDLARSIPLRKFIGSIVACKRGSEIIGISVNPFYEDIEAASEWLRMFGIGHIYAMQITIIISEEGILDRFIRKTPL